MGSLVRSMVRAREREKGRAAASQHRHTESWIELLEFCRRHSRHGDMEFQSGSNEERVACLPCSLSLECGALPRQLIYELFRQFEFCVWLDL
jgi:hypothetical protein